MRMIVRLLMEFSILLTQLDNQFHEMTSENDTCYGDIPGKTLVEKTCHDLAKDL